MATSDIFADTAWLDLTQTSDTSSEKNDSVTELVEQAVTGIVMLSSSGSSSAMDLPSSPPQGSPLGAPVPTITEEKTRDSELDGLRRSLFHGDHSEIMSTVDVLLTRIADHQLDEDLHGDIADVLHCCASYEVEELEERAVQVSDLMLISSYADVVRDGRREHGVRAAEGLGFREYDVPRAVDRLVWVTTVEWGLSCGIAKYGYDHKDWNDEDVLDFICHSLRDMGLSEKDKSLSLIRRGDVIPVFQVAETILTHHVHFMSEQGRSVYSQLSALNLTRSDADQLYRRFLEQARSAGSSSLSLLRERLHAPAALKRKRSRDTHGAPETHRRRLSHDGR